MLIKAHGTSQQEAAIKTVWNSSQHTEFMFNYIKGNKKIDIHFTASFVRKKIR